MEIGTWKICGWKGKQQGKQIILKVEFERGPVYNLLTNLGAYLGKGTYWQFFTS